MFAAALLSIFLQLALNTGLTKAGHSCDELKIGIHKRSDAYNLLCPDYDGYLSCCCSTIRLDLQVQQLKYKDQCQHVKGKSCADIYKLGEKQDGVYTIDPDGNGPFQVRCDMQTDPGGWTVFQRRQDGSENFTRRWSDYKDGFGDLNGEFWLGLDKIHRLSKSGQNVLRVDLMDFKGAQRNATYGKFSVADGSDKYRLNIGSYAEGNAGDSLSWHDTMKFSTYDNDNDMAYSGNCAKNWMGGWWYKSCAHSNLNGLYLGAGKTSYKGNHWRDWKYDSLKKVEMKMRPSLKKS